MSDRDAAPRDGFAPSGRGLGSLLLNPDAALPPGYDGYRRAVADHLQRFFTPFRGDVYELCAYHLGWRDERLQPAGRPAGKMLRPALCLSVCRGFGDPARAVGAAAAIELLHAFSLVHDDIEDNDVERRGRPTLWKLFGVPLALNAGDSLFALAHRVLFEAVAALSPRRSPPALCLFSDACLRMIEGQHRDIDFESRPSVSTLEYVEMSRGKTGAVLGASLALGALFGDADEQAVETLRLAGVELGLAFQAVDDVLAIWGDPALTGKAVGNDLARGKKSLPVALARERGWSLPADGIALERLRRELEDLGVLDAVQRFAVDHADAARRGIAAAITGEGQAEAALADLAALIDFTLARRG